MSCSVIGYGVDRECQSWQAGTDAEHDARTWCQHVQHRDNNRNTTNYKNSSARLNERCWWKGDMKRHWWNDVWMNEWTCSGQESTAGGLWRQSGTSGHAQLLCAHVTANTSHQTVGCESLWRQVRSLSLSLSLFAFIVYTVSTKYYTILIFYTSNNCDRATSIHR